MLSILLLAAALPATAPLTPAGKWEVEYGKDMCVLSRAYGDEKGGAILALRPYPMSSQSEIVVITSGRSAEVAGGKAEVALLPGMHSTQGTYSRYQLVKSPRSLSTLLMNEDALADVRTSTALSIRLGTRESYTFAIPAIASAMRALEACQADLLKTWGIDPAERAEVITPPKANPASFFGPDAYPAAALRAGQQGRTIAVAVIDKKGTVKTCIVAATSGSPTLDRATCDVLTQRGRFSPGLDKDGNAVSAHVVVPVKWVLP